ncbi:MAG: hypothetical protein ACTS4V_00750 [Candidatus Hodgkinia cicadicola]
MLIFHPFGVPLRNYYFTKVSIAPSQYMFNRWTVSFGLLNPIWLRF